MIQIAQLPSNAWGVARGGEQKGEGCLWSTLCLNLLTAPPGRRCSLHYPLPPLCVQWPRPRLWKCLFNLTGPGVPQLLLSTLDLQPSSCLLTEASRVPTALRSAGPPGLQCPSSCPVPSDLLKLSGGGVGSPSASPDSSFCPSLHPSTH